MKRSSSSSEAAAVRLGMANRMRKAVTKVVQTNIGMRLIVMPGARRRRTVTTKLTLPAMDDTPEQLHGQHPEVHVEARGELPAGQRRVGKPAGVRRAAEDEAD